MLEFLRQLRHVLLELDSFFLFVMIFGKRLEVDSRDSLILAIELVQFQDRVGLALRVGRIVAELIRFAMLLGAHFIALLTAAKIEAFPTVHL